MKRPTDLLGGDGQPRPAQVLAAIAVALVVAETAVIAVRPQLPPLSPVERIALESLVPALLVGPVLYRHLLVPLAESVAEREENSRRLEQYEDLVTNLPIGVFRTTPGSEGRFLEVNPAMVSMFEAGSKAALLERTVADLHRDPENRAAFSEKLLAEGIVEDEVMPLQTLADTPIWGSVAAIKKETEDGELFFDGIVLDVTDRVETKEALERSEQKYATLVEESNNGIVIIQDGEYAFVNARMGEILSVDPEALVGKPFVEYLAPEHREMVAERYERRMAGETPPKRYEAEAVRADGRAVPIEISGSRIEYEGRPADMAIVSDITERKAHEGTLRALQESARKLMRADSRATIADLVVETGTELLDHHAGAVWFADDDTLSLAASTDWQDDADPAQVGRDSQLRECFVAGEPVVLDAPDLGSVEWPAGPIQSAVVLPLDDHGLLAFGSPERGDFDDSALDLATILAANAEAALDRVEREHKLREQGEQLTRRNDQLEFLHSLLRHDLLNGMQVLTARADYLDGRVSDDNQEYVETIQHWCADMVRLVEKVRASLEVVTGCNRPEVGPVDLGATLESVLGRVRQTYPSVAVRADVPDGCAVLADDMLAEVLGNVITNAVEHNRDENLTLSVSVERNWDTIAVRVADDGSGIDDDRKKAIFERGASGRDGSGFGLYFVETMVSTYGGEVRVEDNDPTGAVFVIDLPAADADLNLAKTDPQT
jgi:PAS domain S-box-containing protein